MGMGAAQLLAVVCGEIGDRNPAAGPGDPRGFGQNGFGLLRIMQHLVEQHRIERGIGKGQRAKIARHQPHLVSRQMLKPGAGNPEHFRTLVESRYMAGARREQFGHAARARTHIEQRPEAVLPKRAG